MELYYCEYCGNKSMNNDVFSSSLCLKHPTGALKGFHKPYVETNKQNIHICIHCGMQSTSLSTLINGECLRHPNGQCKGKHEPVFKDFKV